MIIFNYICLYFEVQELLLHLSTINTQSHLLASCANQPCKRFPDYSCLRVQILMCALACCLIVMEDNLTHIFRAISSQDGWILSAILMFLSPLPPGCSKKISFSTEPFEGPCSILPFYFLVVSMAPKQQIKLSLFQRPCLGTQ